LVLAAADRSSPEGETALETLCEAYWYPVYAFVRRRGHDEQEAADLTQGFFAKLLEKNYVGDARRDRGKFRTFLLTSVTNFLSNEHERAAAQKRGGYKTIQSLDFANAEDRYRREPDEGLTAEQLFERRWAMGVLGKLQQRYVDKGRFQVFDLLKPHLAGGGSDTYQQIATKLGASEAAVKQQVRRLRQRCRDLVRAEIADTVADPEEIEDELRRLFRAVSQ
jgi:RNA polymerase sigma-70 factor (ECF subfamily)